MATIDEVMGDLPERFRPKLAGNMRAVIQFEFTGIGNGQWVLNIRNGQCEVRQGMTDNPDATVTMSAADFVGINSGEIDAPDVFWSGRIQIQGNVETVIGLAPIMGWQ